MRKRTHLSAWICAETKCAGALALTGRRPEGRPPYEMAARPPAKHVRADTPRALVPLRSTVLAVRPYIVIASQCAHWCGNPLLLLLRHKATDSHASDIGHWLGMTDFFDRPKPETAKAVSGLL